MRVGEEGKGGKGWGRRERGEIEKVCDYSFFDFFNSSQGSIIKSSAIQVQKNNKNGTI